MKKYLVALDQGTTSSRAIVFDRSQQIVASAQKEFPQLYPQAGWVEHDPLELYSSQYGVMMEAITRGGIDPAEIAAIGITNQRETTIVWEKATGRPISPAIVWQCRRTAALCDRLRADGLTEHIRAVTGLVPDAYFSATKIRWILDHVPGAQERAERGELLFGTVDSWLIWNFTKGAVHATDPSNASRTLMFNIHTGDWDDELLELLSVPRSMLPKVVPSSGIMGHMHPEFLGHSLPLAGDAGDQQAATYGNACMLPGMAKNTYGTGCFTLMNVGDTPVRSRSGLVTTVGWQVGGETVYALEGSVFNAGSTIQWLRDELGLIQSAPECDRLAESVPDSGGVVVVPAFTGLGAPYWDMYARGTIVGLTRGSTKAHIARAVLECIAYQTADLVRVMNADAPCPLTELRVDGGASVSDILMQIQADLLRLPVDRPAQVETTAFGAAALAGLAVGVWNGFDELAALRRSQCVFRPQREEEACLADLARWHRAVERSRSWIENNV